VVKQQDHRHLHWGKLFLACGDEARWALVTTLQNEGRSPVMEQAPTEAED